MVMRREKRPDTADARAEMRRLLADVPEDPSADDPALIACLDFWQSLPHRARPRVNAYKVRGGGWLIDGADAVVPQLREWASV